MERFIGIGGRLDLFVIFFLSLILAVMQVKGQSPMGDGKMVMNSEVGNWSVGNCLMASFDLEMTIYPNNSDRNASSVLSVPVTASVVSDPNTCQNNETQQLKLAWSDTAQNGTELLRNLTISFHLNKTDYGINEIYGFFVMGLWNETESHVNDKNETVNVTVLHQNILTVDSGKMKDNLLLKTPINRSYLCANPGNVSLSTHLLTNNGSPLGEVMKNTTFFAKTVRFDVFRGPNTTPNVMQTALNCDYRPNDFVPIGVGIALALLVGFVLTAYLIGRRRVRQRGYQSV